MPRGGEAAREHGSSEALTRPAAASITAVEEAKRELLTAVPSPRGFQRRSIADALLAFEERLRDAAELINTSKVGPEALPDRFTGAIANAQARAERLRLDAPTLDYESLISVLADLMEPLDVFGDTEDGTTPDQSTRRR